MKNRKKLLIIGASLLAVAVLGTGITLAYLADEEVKDNDITVGKGDVSITESFPDVSEQSMQNENIKEVKVKNTGTVPCYVRVYAEFSDSLVADKASVRNRQGRDTNYYKWAEFKNKLAESTNTISSKWKYVNDNPSLGGYFYYTEPIAAGKETELLFTDVKTDYKDPNNANDSNIDKIQAYDIIVYSEVVQTTDIDGSEFSDDTEPPNKKAWYKAWERFLK